MVAALAPSCPASGPTAASSAPWLASPRRAGPRPAWPGALRSPGSTCQAQPQPRRGRHQPLPRRSRA